MYVIKLKIPKNKKVQKTLKEVAVPLLERLTSG